MVLNAIYFSFILKSEVVSYLDAISINEVVFLVINSIDLSDDLPHSWRTTRSWSLGVAICQIQQYVANHVVYLYYQVVSDTTNIKFSDQLRVCLQSCEALPVNCMDVQHYIFGSELLGLWLLELLTTEITETS